MKEYSVYYYKRKKQKNKAYLKVAVIILAFITICSVICGFFVFTYSPSETCALKYNFYFVSTGKYDNYTSASVYAKKCRDKGGAGYIYKESDGYNVIAAVYYKSEEAQSIADSLKRSGDNAKVILLETQQIKSRNKNCREGVLKLDLLLAESYNLCINAEIGVFDGALLRSETERLKSNLLEGSLTAVNDAAKSCLENSYNRLSGLLSGELRVKDLRYYNCELCANLFILVFS